MDDFYNDDNDCMDEIYDENYSTNDDCWFTEECLEITTSFKDWAKRNSLFLFEKLESDNIEEYIDFDFSFSNKNMDLNNDSFCKWKKCYNQWLNDFRAFEIILTPFSNCPVDNLYWFIYKTSSKRLPCSRS